MPGYFETLEQAKKYIYQKKTMAPRPIAWRIVDCQIGFLVVSEAQAYQCFPDLLHDSQDQASDL